MTNPVSAARLVAFLALAYAALGAAGLTLAIPPGYASPVFPASGLALAFALWFGHRALPGVWLGSALLNLTQTWLYGTLSPATAAMVCAIASGAATQAWAGRWLLNRWQGPAWRNLERERDVFGFLLLGGALACLVSASFGATSLYAAGVIKRAEFLFTWWNWYVGDTLGVLVFAPLSLCLLNRQDSLWIRRRRNSGQADQRPRDHAPRSARFAAQLHRGHAGLQLQTIRAIHPGHPAGQPRHFRAELRRSGQPRPAA